MSTGKKILKSKRAGLSCVYTLFSILTAELYVGFSDNFKGRLSQHHQGSVPSTRNLRPLALLGMEYFQSRSDALKREAYLKSDSGQKHLRWMYSEALDIFARQRKKILSQLNQG